jgi:hypothetical protein
MITLRGSSSAGASAYHDLLPAGRSQENIRVKKKKIVIVLQMEASIGKLLMMITVFRIHRVKRSIYT